MSKSSDLETIDHQILLRLSQSNLVQAVIVVGKKEGWQIIVKYGDVECYLSSTRKQVRVFRKLETAIFYLKDLGVEEVIVKVADYNPKVKTGKRSRPDRSEVLKKTHAAARTFLKS